MERRRRDLHRLGLELGGKDPGYVMETPISTPPSTR
jgi:acyl-CoA reductase-like NAD-dependent aldehyde dehydrogenase